ncbi:acylphosphatase [Texcoconibacillus texcoconensis]|uniref:Acylphosphatase n=1 Tax=Texcoconibacillus texcoconensis TaxID=1095777 RepID=A0A840QTT5_9BACI|nr:acylphosphatase [Texcoconibacillus texcoconensis]MBB5174677.1 acylphosphatase [Texcoconibacillus texcoconensis]
MLKRIHATVSGRVQGVGFRFFTQQIATEYHLTGWVRNCSDGTVELEAEGGPQNIKSFLEKVKKGTIAAKVEHINVNDIPVRNEEKGFNIKK